MSIYQKARELGEEILNSDYGAMLAEAKINFENNTKVSDQLDYYTQYRADYLEKLRKRELSPQDIAHEQKKIDAMQFDLSQEVDLTRLLDAEENFNNYVNHILDILKLTISGESSCGSSSGGCSGCSK